MNVPKNARLTPIGRELVVMQVASGQRPQAAARAAGVCPRALRKWMARHAAEGGAGLADRSSRPRRRNRPTPQHIVARIGELRRQRLSGKHVLIDPSKPINWERFRLDDLVSNDREALRTRANASESRRGL